MKVLDKFNQISSNIFSLLKKEHYNAFDFQNLLLQTNKSVRKIVFKYNGQNSKYESFLDTNNIEINNNLFVNIIFTQAKGSVTYEFFNREHKELVTIFTNGQYHDFLMEGIKVVDKKQIQQIYDLLDLSKTLLSVQKICQQKKEENQKVTVEKPTLTPSYITNTVFADFDNKDFIANKINNLKENLHVSIIKKIKI